MYPYMVYITSVREESKTSTKLKNCGGSLIRQNLVLTAAHCINPKIIEGIGVYLGRHNSPALGAWPDNTVTDVWIHPGYSHENRYHNDIAILVLKKPVDYNKHIKRICLPDSNFVNYTEAIQTGWGLTDGKSNVGSSVLKELKLHPNNETKCEDMVKVGNETNDELSVKLNQIICTQSIGANFTCDGDSGGPLVVEEAGKFVQIGIVSMSKGNCGADEKQLLHTRVSAYMFDIKKIIEKYGHKC